MRLVAAIAVALPLAAQAAEPPTDPARMAAFVSMMVSEGCVISDKRPTKALSDWMRVNSIEVAELRPIVDDLEKLGHLRVESDALILVSKSCPAEPLAEFAAKRRAALVGIIAGNGCRLSDRGSSPKVIEGMMANGFDKTELRNIAGDLVSSGAASFQGEYLVLTPAACVAGTPK